MPHGLPLHPWYAQEDFFYALLMERSQGEFRLPPRDMAYRFCVEVRWLAWLLLAGAVWLLVR